MKNVQKIIDLWGGLDRLKSGDDYIRLEVPHFMRLVIEHLGTGPRGGDLISVAHYGEQNGDAMRDPEIVFDVRDGHWLPLSIRQDYVGSYLEALFTGADGKVSIRPELAKDINSFARLWDKNLQEQGFVAAAEAKRVAP